MQSHSAPPGLCPPTTGARGAAAPAHARPPTARWSSRARWLYGCKDPASRSGGSRELEKPALRAICEDTRNAVRARVRLCPTACPTALQFPMVKPNQAGIIIRVSGFESLLRHPAERLGARGLASRSLFLDSRRAARGGWHPSTDWMICASSVVGVQPRVQRMKTECPHVRAVAVAPSKLQPPGAEARRHLGAS